MEKLTHLAGYKVNVFLFLIWVIFRSLSDHTEVFLKSRFLVKRAKVGNLVNFSIQNICRNSHLRLSICDFSGFIMCKDIRLLCIHIYRAWMRNKRGSAAVGSSLQCGRYHNSQAMSSLLVQKGNSHNLLPAHGLPLKILHEYIRPDCI